MTSPLDKAEAKLKAEMSEMTPHDHGTMVSRETIQLRWMTDRGLCIPMDTNTSGLYRRLTVARLPGVVEVVPADGMLLVVLEPGASPPQELLNVLNGLPLEEAIAVDIREHEIPVHFDGEDLPEIAKRVGRSAEVLAELLCSLNLHVKFLGFQPGFAYLDGLPPELHLPRRANPRKMVPAGSVALGGGYCGIYPSAGPGGWHLIGSTTLSLFDPFAEPPARLQPGDTVRLVMA
jgi:KipI family sensor histidine kinase inhibitor